MSTSISFLELRLEAGDLIAVLGSGRFEEVLARAISQPYVRICMRDPDVVDFRVRCGTAELTEDGLDYSLWDDFQARGVSIRLFAWSSSIVRCIRDSSDVVRRRLLERSPIWLEFNDGAFTDIDESPAREALSTNNPTDESRVFVQFEVPLAHCDEVLAILGRDQTAGSEN